jgi:hypothetical protein
MQERKSQRSRLSVTPILSALFHEFGVISTEGRYLFSLELTAVNGIEVLRLSLSN